MRKIFTFLASLIFVTSLYAATGSITNTSRFPISLSASDVTNVTLPTSGTLVNTGVTTLSSLSSIGTITTGVWHGSVIGSLYGGSGLASPTAHSILIGEGSSAFTPLNLTNGQLLIGSTGADPVAATLSNGTNITWSTGAGTLTGNLTGQVSAANGGTNANNTATSGTLLSGNGTAFVPVTALPNGITATTQTAGDNSTKVATTAYVATAVAAIPGITSWVHNTSAGAGGTVAVNTGYMIDTGSGATTYTFPSTCNFGSTVKIYQFSNAGTSTFTLTFPGGTTAYSASGNTVSGGQISMSTSNNNVQGVDLFCVSSTSVLILNATGTVGLT